MKKIKIKSRSVVSDSLWPHELLHARPPCPSPTPRVYPNPCPLSWWCHPTISSSVIPFSSRLQSFPASGSFPMSWFFVSSGQSTGVSASASVLLMNIQDWFPIGWTGWISLRPKWLSRIFSNTTVQKHQFFGAQLSHYKSAFEITELCWCAIKSIRHVLWRGNSDIIWTLSTFEKEWGLLDKDIFTPLFSPETSPCQ